MNFPWNRTLLKCPAFAWNIWAYFPETMWLKVITEIFRCDLKYSHENSFYKCYLLNGKISTNSVKKPTPTDLASHTRKNVSYKTKPAAAFKLKVCQLKCTHKLLINTPEETFFWHVTLCFIMKHFQLKEQQIQIYIYFLGLCKCTCVCVFVFDI